MENVTLVLNSSLQNLLQTTHLTLGDVEQIRLILTGGSVIDWTRLYFKSLPAVNKFLRVNCYDPSDARDVERLHEIHAAAIAYLKSVFNMQFPLALEKPKKIQNLFLYASSEGKYQRDTCVILKTMQVINHLEARELLFHLPTSERELFALVEEKVTSVVNEMLARGFPIDSYQPSRKTKESLVTKILSKRKATAAQVFDRVRFRIITKDKAGIIPILVYLKENLIPFNYVIPDESRNTIAPIGELIRLATGYFPTGIVTDPTEALTRKIDNPFTHAEYRAISFVADIPLRVDKIIQKAGLVHLEKFGRIVFIPAEFQVMDRESYDRNEQGPACHKNYKLRQEREVLRRLLQMDPSRITVR